MAASDIWGVISEDPLLFAIPAVIVLGFLALIWKNKDKVTGDASSGDDGSFNHANDGDNGE